MGSTRAGLLLFLLARTWSPAPGEALSEADQYFPPVLHHPQAVAASRTLATGKPALAARLAQSALQSADLDQEERAAVSFLHALGLSGSGQRSAALPILKKLTDGQTPPGLATHAAWHYGRLLVKGSLPERELARGFLSQVPLSSRFGFQARLLLIKNLVADGKLEEGCLLATETAELRKGKPGDAAAQLQVALCQERLAAAVAREGRWKESRQMLSEAAGFYRDLAHLWPHRPAGLSAANHLHRLVQQGIRPNPPEPETLLERAREIVRYPRGRRDLATLDRIRALLPKRPDDPSRCEINLLFAELAAYYRWFKPAYRLLRSMKHSADPELSARTGLLLAGLMARWRPQAAISEYVTVAERWPKTSFAASALYRAGDLAMHLRKTKVSRDTFLLCVEKYPDTPEATRCRFALAWIAYREGKYPEALSWLDFLLAMTDLTPDEGKTVMDEPPEACLEEKCPEEAPEQTQTSGEADAQNGEPPSKAELEEEPETSEEEEEATNLKSLMALSLEHRRFREKVRYWHARTLEARGEPEAAREDYRRLVHEHPYDYYSLMAWERLLALGEEVAVDPLPSRSTPEGQPPLPQEEALHPEVAAAVSYLRMGLSWETRETLLALQREGLGNPDRRVASRLWQALGDYRRSHRMAPLPWEGGLPGFPGEKLLDHARLAYPRAFAEIVEGPDCDPDVSPSLLLALVRAESAFDPKAHSTARALGLTQMVHRTAQRTARRLGMKNFRFWKIARPDVAIRVGSSHLADLLRRFDGQLALALAAYNAGEPAVTRWLKLQGELPLDAFIEEIPYTETNRYVRKVLSFYAIYRVLYEARPKRPLDLSFIFPNELIQKAKISSPSEGKNQRSFP